MLIPGATKLLQRYMSCLVCLPLRWSDCIKSFNFVASLILWAKLCPQTHTHTPSTELIHLLFISQCYIYNPSCLESSDSSTSEHDSLLPPLSLFPWLDTNNHNSRKEKEAFYNDRFNHILPKPEEGTTISNWGTSIKGREWPTPTSGVSRCSLSGDARAKLGLDNKAVYHSFKGPELFHWPVLAFPDPKYTHIFCVMEGQESSLCCRNSSLPWAHVLYLP